LLQHQMHGGYFLLARTPRIEAGIPLFGFLSTSFSPWGSPTLLTGYIIYMTLGQHFHTARVQ